MPDALKPSVFLSEGFGMEAILATEDLSPVQAPIRTSSPGEKPYPKEWELSGTVERTTFGTYSGERFFDLDVAGQVKNTTDWSNDALLEESRKTPAFNILADGTPEVLILHTHTTETFEPCVRDSFDSSFNYRTTDPSKNMVMVGDAIEAQLQKAGIGVIHSTQVNDYPSYTGSYDRSRADAERILEEFPTIKVILDIHRDAIGNESTITQPYTVIDGKETSQIMIISGCDDGTMDMPNYLENFHLACLFQQQMESDYPGLTRPILFDYRHYNQDMTTGSLLIEVGSHGNTLEQAQYAGELIGASIARALLTLTE